LGTATNRTFRIMDDAQVTTGLDAGKSVIHDVTPAWTIPADIPPGNYQIWVHADSGDVIYESDEINNWGHSASFAVVTAPQIEVLLDSNTVLPSPDTAPMGGNYLINARLHNPNVVPITIAIDWQEHYISAPRPVEPQRGGHVSPDTVVGPGQTALVTLGQFSRSWQWISPQNPIDSILLQSAKDLVKEAGEDYGKNLLDKVREKLGSAITVFSEIFRLADLGVDLFIDYTTSARYTAFGNYGGLSLVSANKSVDITVPFHQKTYYWGYLALKNSASLLALAVVKSLVAGNFPGALAAGLGSVAALVQARQTYEYALDPPLQPFNVRALAGGTSVISEYGKTLFSLHRDVSTAISQGIPRREVSVHERNALDIAQRDIDASFAEMEPPEVVRDQVERYIDSVIGIARGTNNVTALQKDIDFGFLALEGLPEPTIDVGDGAVTFDYPVPDLNRTEATRARIISGRGGVGIGNATWTGPGINSSAAASDPDRLAVGYADNGTLPLGPYQKFQGADVDDTTVLVRYTPAGDANLDGVVNDDDVTVVNAYYAPNVPNANWAFGDFDYNGFVDDDDVTLLGASYEPAPTVDVRDGISIVDYAVGDFNPTNHTRSRIITGRAGVGIGRASWNGPGINSSAAASDPEVFSVGYADNAALPLGAYTSFRGVPVDATAVLIAYTRTGDATLDGVVNDDDVTIVGANYAPGVPNANWAMGDFDYNGFVDDDDVTLLGAFYQPPAAAAPPLTVSGGGVSGEAAAKYEVQIPKDETSAGLAAGETFGLLGVRGLGFDELSPRETRAQRGVMGVRGRGFDELSSSLSLRAEGRETRAQQETRAQRAKALTLPSSDLPSAGARRGISASRDDEILLLAESLVAQAAGRGAGLGETGLPLRLAVSEVMEFWWA
jgi:hypothetical protein